MLTKKCARCSGPVWLDAVTEQGCPDLDWWVVCGNCGEIFGVIDRRGTLTPYGQPAARPVADYRLR